MKVAEFIRQRTNHWGYILVTSKFTEAGKKKVHGAPRWSTTGETYRYTDMKPAARNQTPTRPEQDYSATSGVITEEYLCFDTTELNVLDIDNPELKADLSGPHYLSRGKLWLNSLSCHSFSAIRFNHKIICLIYDFRSKLCISLKSGIHNLINLLRKSIKQQI